MVWNSFLTFSWGQQYFCWMRQPCSPLYPCLETQDLEAQCVQILPASLLQSSSWGLWTMGSLHHRGSASSCCVWAPRSAAAAQGPLQLAHPAASRVSSASWSAPSWRQLLAAYSFWSMKVGVLGCQSWMRRGSSSFRCSSCWSWDDIRVLRRSSCRQLGLRATSYHRS